jgi:hypothetical protein
MTPESKPAGLGFAALRRFANAAAAAPERCDLCGAPLATEHPHLVEPAARRLLCACDACALLFPHRADTKYRRVPRRVRTLPEFRLNDAQWDALAIPIGLAFFFHSGPAGKVVALYPSPAGPAESLLDLAAWADVERDNPVLKEWEPDTEALLVNRLRDAREYYLAPIDECYKLTGLIRGRWRGLSGGAELWDEIGRFFDALRRRAEVARA